MADHVLTLTDIEEILLSRLTERTNQRRAAESSDDESPRSFTEDEFLQWLFRKHLGEIQEELQNSTQDYSIILPLLTAAQRTAVLSKIADGPRKDWLQTRLTEGK